MPGEGMGEVSTAIGDERGAHAPGAHLVPALTIASHPVPRRVGERLLLTGLGGGRQVLLARSSPDFTAPGSLLGTPLLDPFVSRKPLVLSAAEGGALRLAAPEGGTRVVVDGRPLAGECVLPAAALQAGVALELAGRVVLLAHLAPAEGPPPTPYALGMVGESAALHEVRRHVERVADLRVPVLLRGETGTGKELVARAIYQRSVRPGSRFISVNLGAIPRELAAAELFGAVKGAFTGALKDREGLFHAAHGGTLFLDEVGEAPPEVQVMLLRVLEAGELFPVGATRPVPVDVRIIAATDADLEERIQSGSFKAPLLHRLAGYEIRVPPLRERREDVGPLFHHFAREELELLGEVHRLQPEDPYAEPWLPAPLAAQLLRHPWPGNIRQLRNVARQLVIGNRGQAVLQLDAALAQELAQAPSARAPEPAAPEPAAQEPARRKPSDVTEAELLAALRESAWDLKASAARLGISRPSLYDLIDRSPGIRTAGDLSPAELQRAFAECEGDLDRMVQRLEVSRRALTRRLKELALEPRGR
ncbi:sigma-54-dependent Fis family transcriptional regulator [Aggregicoccus sp. 17bor-14]|uniref:sigma 54-interacting transcriptional regulator n=1 Tax=Myxococcaceae TaxID=31 RepID=UPI00129CA475|nr:MULTISPECIES: sigma 54-interacting transcriptional regulator [Myxococcaceae]MBF5045005.1 sigma-54-dependent Fis family transcriptional regulator [Simulacricoccus sp. 17bor-14]MRI90748.1 sigma-54-dependent Fis family transcriptional regulator [Aggregicoccus sp. 17bor-14]